MATSDERRETERRPRVRSAGASVEGATYLAVFFERAARMQLRAMAAGGVKEVKPELAAEAREFLLRPSIVRGTGRAA